MKTRFVSNPSFHDELGNSPQFRRFMGQAGRAVQAGIRDNLPVGRRGGRMARPFGTRTFSTTEGAGREVSVAVGTRWKLGHIIEFGGPHSAAYSPVRKAAIQSGMRFDRGR